jgi:hypothetical protein
MSQKGQIQSLAGPRANGGIAPKADIATAIGFDPAELIESLGR